MKLMIKPQNIVEVRKKTRQVLEKLHDLSFGKKFRKRLHRNAIAKRVGKASDVQVCLQLIVDCYECYIQNRSVLDNPQDKSYDTLLKNMSLLDQKILDSIKHNKPVPRKYISDLLKSHTEYFNNLKHKQFNSDCTDLYDKLILSAISVWNNHWK